MNKAMEKTDQPGQSWPPLVDYELPEPPVAPCTPEEHDQWFRTKVQEALDHPGPGLSLDEAMSVLESRLER